MPQSYTNLVYHLVFSTKYREPIITTEHRPRLYRYIGGTIRGLGGGALAVGGVSDHVHILTRLRPDRSLSDVLRELKANASGWMHRVFPDARHFYWQNGYGAFTVSASQVPRVRRYIAGQEQHHRKYGFKTEFARMLRSNRIEFEEKHLWK